MWNIAGWLFVMVGAIGVAVPVLPTVPFILLAAFCFERGSPELHKWLIEHPTFGPPLRNWRYHRVIGPKSKAIAVLGITASVSYVLFFRDLPIALKAVIGAVSAGVVVFILVQKSRPDRGPG